MEKTKVVDLSVFGCLKQYILTISILIFLLFYYLILLLTIGKCKPSISSREVVRKGLALIFKFDQYPSHINDPTGCENDTNLFHALMIKYQFDVWREDNLRSQSVYQTLLEAQLFLKTHPKM